MNKKSDIILRGKRLFSREEQFHEAKKTVPAEVVPKPVNDAAPVPEKDHPLYDRLFVVGFAVLLFFAMTVQTVPMSLILAAVALALSFGRGGYARFRGRLGIPVLGFLAF